VTVGQRKLQINVKLQNKVLIVVITQQ